MICQYCGHKLQSITEDDKGYVPADLVRELVEKAEAYCNDPYRCTRDDKRDALIKALAAYRGEK